MKKRTWQRPDEDRGDAPPSGSGGDAVEAEVRRLAADSIGRRGERGFAQDGRLIDAQTGFDSIAFMEFVLCVEQTFGIEIPDEDLQHDIFESVRTVTDYVRRKTASFPDKPLTDH